VLFRFLFLTFQDVNAAIASYNFSAATESVTTWWRACLADVYLEAIKPRTKSGDAGTKSRAAHVLHTCLDVGLKVLHPIMPFVTEELWQRLPRRRGDPVSIMICAYPNEEATRGWKNAALEEHVAWLLDVCQKTRSAKASYNITRKQDPEIIYVVSTEEKKALFEEWVPVVCPLVYASKIRVEQQGAESKTETKGCALSIVDDTCQVLVRLAGLGLDYGAELQKLRSERRRKTREAESLRSQMQQPTYEKKPQDVQEKERVLLDSLDSELTMTEKGIADFLRLLLEEGIAAPEEVTTPEPPKKEKKEATPKKDAAKKKQEEKK
jgi:valyl-tRNA synthetase